MKRAVAELEQMASNLSLESDDFLSKDNKSVRMNDSIDKSRVCSFVQNQRCANCTNQATMIGIHQGSEVYVCDPCNELLWM